MDVYEIKFLSKSAFITLLNLHRCSNEWPNGLKDQEVKANIMFVIFLPKLLENINMENNK